MDILFNICENKSALNMHEDEHVKLNITDVMEVIEYIKSLEKERDSKDYEIENLKVQMKFLLSDIDILEDLYKKNMNEVIKQEIIINSLRQCYLDHREEEINWKTENVLLQSKLENSYILLNTFQSTQEDIDVIKMHLKNLQCLLKMDFTSPTVDSSINKKYRKSAKKSRLKKKTKKQSFQAILDQNKLYLNELKATVISEYKDLHKNLNSTKVTEKVGNFEREIAEVKNILLTIQTSPKDSQDNYNQIKNEYNELCKSSMHIGEQMRHEHSTVLWLESELQESVNKGAKICYESKQMFGIFKKWLHLVKKERRGMLMKIKELHCMNKMLLRTVNGEDNE